MPFVDRFARIDGRRVGYVDEGSGDTPLLLLHGGGFDHGELTWKPVVRELRDRYRMIVPDLPGYGESDGFGRPHDLADLGRWTLAFLDELGLGAVDVSGVSMGGGIALWLTLEAPERVRKLVPVGAYGTMARAPFHPLALALARSPLSGLVYQAAARSRVAARLGLGASYAALDRVTDATVADVMAVAAEQGRRRSFDAFLAAELGPKGLKSDLTARLPLIRRPTLVVHGTSDRIVPVRHGKRAAELIPGAELALMPTGHWPMRELPGLFARRLDRFLSDGSSS